MSAGLVTRHQNRSGVQTAKRSRPVNDDENDNQVALEPDHAKKAKVSIEVTADNQTTIGEKILATKDQVYFLVG